MFIKDFANIASPLLSLMKENLKFVRTAKHDEAFKIIINALITAPMLHRPVADAPFISFFATRAIQVWEMS